MVVTTGKGQGDVHINKRGLSVVIHAGERAEVPVHRILDLLDRGILVHAEFPEIINNTIAVADVGFVADIDTVKCRRAIWRFSNVAD
jgi:hypothetical protein